MTGLVAVVAALLAVNVGSAIVVILLRIRNNLRAGRFGRIEAHWEPVIIGIISGSDEPVPPVPDEEVRHVLVIAGRFSRRVRGPDREKVQEFAAPLVAALLPDLGARSPEKRASAVELLSVLALDEHANRIVSALDDPSPRVSLVAARALSHPNHPQHTAAVLNRLHRYSNWSSSLISSMLAQVGTGALEDLRNYFQDETRPTQARAVVAGALRLLRDPRGAEIAAEALDSDDLELVVACLRLIDGVGSAKQADAVRGLISHPVFFVRSEAVTALSHVGAPSDVDAIERTIHEDSPWVAIRAARALLTLGQRRTLEDLSLGEGLAANSAREVLREEAV